MSNLLQRCVSRLNCLEALHTFISDLDSIVLLLLNNYGDKYLVDKIETIEDLILGLEGLPGIGAEILAFECERAMAHYRDSHDIIRLRKQLNDAIRSARSYYVAYSCLLRKTIRRLS